MNRKLQYDTWIVSALMLMVVGIGIVMLRVNAAATATLSLTPNSGTVSVGQNIAVDLILNSANQAVAGADVTLTYSPNLTYMSGDNTNSVFDQEVLAPTVGTNSVRFSRVRFDAGYNGANGNVVHLIFKSTAVGACSISVDTTKTEVITYTDSSNILGTAQNAAFLCQMANGPEINIKRGTTSLPDSSNVDIGATTVNTNLDVTFTIENTGNTPLTLTALGTPPADFQVTSPYAASVAAGATTQFTVRARSSSAGTFNWPISIPNNDSNENPYRINLSYTATVVPEPEMDVFDGSNPIADNATFNLGSTAMNTDLNQTFVIQNNGTATLTLASLATPPAGFQLVTPFAASVTAGNQTTFTIKGRSPSAGTFTWPISITNNDGNENPYHIAVTFTAQAVPAPEIDVRAGAIALADNGSFSMGSVVVTTDITQVFTIENNGNAALTLTALGPPPMGFVLQSPFNPTVAAGGSTSFTVKGNASTTGTFSWPIAIANNDPNENPFDLTVSFSATPQPAPDVSVYVDGSLMVKNGDSIPLKTSPGGSVNKTFTINNTGTAPLSLSNLGTPATSFSVVTPYNNTVAAGGSTTFTVRLTSTTEGSFAWPISITTNVPSRPTIQFGLAGTVATTVSTSKSSTGGGGGTSSISSSGPISSAIAVARAAASSAHSFAVARHAAAGAPAPHVDRICQAYSGLKPNSFDATGFLSTTVNGKTVSFSDLPRDAWFTDTLGKMIQLGFISGYTDAAGTPLGLAGPADPVTHEQIIKMTFNAAGYALQDFSGLPDSSQDLPKYIAAARLLQLTIFQYITPGKPTNIAATRASAVTSLVELFGFDQNTSGGGFPDTNGHPFLPFIMTAKSIGIVKGDDTTKNFRPNNPLNRAEAAALVMRAVDALCK